MAMHPDGVTVATGQIGKHPKICVWDTEDCTIKKELPLSLHNARGASLLIPTALPLSQLSLAPLLPTAPLLTPAWSRS
jgi:hypothetical protein